MRLLLGDILFEHVKEEVVFELSHLEVHLIKNYKEVFYIEEVN